MAGETPGSQAFARCCDLSGAALKRKVADYLRKSQALEDYWQRPLAAEQLQA